MLPTLILQESDTVGSVENRYDGSSTTPKEYRPGDGLLLQRNHYDRPRGTVSELMVLKEDREIRRQFRRPDLTSSPSLSILQVVLVDSTRCYLTQRKWFFPEGRVYR